MAWYYIVLIVLGYLVMDCVGGYLISCVWEDEELAPLLGVFWPAFIAFLLPVWFVKMLKKRKNKKRLELMKNQIG